MSGAVRRHYRVGQKEAEAHQSLVFSEESRRKYMMLGGLVLLFFFIQGLFVGMFVSRD